MKVRELIDFYLTIRTPGRLLGFGSVFSGDLDALKNAIQTHCGSQEAWLALPEDGDLPGEIARIARDLIEKYEAWNNKEEN